MKKFTLFLSLIVLFPLLASAQSVNKNAAQPAVQSAPQGPSVADLQKLIQDLLSQLHSLQAQVAALQGELGKPSESTLAPVTAAPVSNLSPTTPAPISTPELVPVSEPTPPELTRSLSRGSSGDDVRKLQEFLAKDKGIYPDGLITGYFGPLTENAVKKWQEKHGVESAGVIGPKTIAKFQELGRGVIQGLLEQGAGRSGIIPPGLFTAPGIQNKLGFVATTTPPVTTSTTLQATTTPSGTTPAIPAIPAQPFDTGGGGGGGSPAIPAIPAVPAVISTSSVDAIAPSTPTNLVATAISSTQVNLFWAGSTDNVGITGYKIYRNGSLLVSVATTTTAAPSGGQTLYYLVANLSPSTTYTFTVAAYDAAGNISAQSNQASATTFSGTTTATSTDVTAPSVPTNLVAATISSVKIYLTWTPSTDNVGVAGYKVYRNSAYLGLVSATTTYNDLNLSPSTTYTYTVAAYDAAGNTSSQSTSASATTQAAVSHACGTPVNVPQDTSSIQAGLNAACSGDMVFVSAGTYRENITVPRSQLTLKGAPGTTPEQVIIDGGGLADVVSAKAVSDFVIDGFTLQNASQNGSMPGGGGLFINGNSCCSFNAGNTIARNLIIKNNSHGIVVWSVHAGSILLERNLVVSNLYSGIDASYPISSGQMIMTNNTIAKNGRDGYYDFAGGGSRTFRNNVIVSNGRYGIYSNQYTTKYVSYDDVWGNTQRDYCNAEPYGSCITTYTPSPGTGELSVDPKFVGSSDYHLQSTSPAINAGDPSSQYNDPNGTRNDMGAYPFIGSTATTADTTAPSAPTNLTATPVSSSQIGISWTSSTDNVGIAGYKIYRGGSLFTSIATTTAIGTLYYSDSNLSPSTSYSYTVAAYDAVGNISAQSNSASATTQSGGTSDTTAPSVPTDISNYGQSATNIILWGASTDNVGVVGYKIFRDGVYLTSVTTTSYFDTNLASFTSYNYTIAAYDAAGNVSSQSVNVSTITGNASYIPSLATPVLSVDSSSGVPVFLSWNSVSGATSYNLSRRTPPRNGVSFTAVATDYSGTSFSDSGVSGGATYEYRLMACGSSGCSWESVKRVTVTLGGTTADTQAPTTPTGLSANASSSSQINLYWSPSTDNVGVIGYKVYRNSAYVTSISANPTPAFNDTGLSAGTSYSYTVAAYDAAGNISAQSASASATTAAALLAPTGGTNAGGYFGSGGFPGKHHQDIRFNYPSSGLSQVSSFRLYEKKPNDSVFILVDTFSNPAPLVASCGSTMYGTAWNLSYACGAGFWSADTKNSQSSSYFQIGEYDYYVTAVDSSGVESVHSPTIKEYVLQPVEIKSPTSAQSPTIATPTITWTAVISGWPSSWTTPSYYVQVFEDKALTSYMGPIYTKSVSMSAGYTTGSTVYAGPTLDPTKKYVVEIYSGVIIRGSDGQDTSYQSMVKNLETFWVQGQASSTSGAVGSSLADLLESLRSLVAALQKLQTSAQ